MADAEQYVPHFKVDEDVDKDTRRRLTRIENGIADNPLAFAEMLEKLGALAFDSVEHHEKIVDLQLPADQPPARMILDFFGLRLDREASFDEATEAALTQDEAYAQLLQHQQTLSNQMLTAGVQKRVMRANPESDSARDAVRCARFGFYIGRVMESKGIVIAASDTPEEPEEELAPEESAEPTGAEVTSPAIPEQPGPSEDEALEEQVKRTELPNPRETPENKDALQQAG